MWFLFSLDRLSLESVDMFAALDEQLSIAEDDFSLVGRGGVGILDIGRRCVGIDGA